MDSIPSPIDSPPTTFTPNEAINLYSPLTNLETSEPSSEESEQHFTRSRLPITTSTTTTDLNISTAVKSEGSNMTQNLNYTVRSGSYVPYKPFTAHSHMPPTPSSASTSDESRSPSPEYTSIPSFVNPDSYLPSDDPDSSSSDEDNPKPIRPPTYSRDGKLRPRPKYYYDSNFDPANSNNNNQKRKKRRGGYKGIPVFEPTEEDFMGTDGTEGGGFYEYVKRIEKYGMRSGVVKVIPPKSWIDSLPSVSAPLRTIRLKEPISQHILGSQGLYRVTNVAKTRIWNPAQWKGLAEDEKYTGPNFAEDSKKGDRSERSTRGSRSGPSVKKAVADKKGKGKKVEVVVEAVEAEQNDDMEVDETVEDEEKAMEADIEDGDGKDANNTATPVRRDSNSSTSIPTPSPRHSISMDSNITPDLPSEGTPVAESTSLSEEATSIPSDLPEALALPSTSTRSQNQIQPQTPASAQKKTKRPTNMQRAEPTEVEWQEFMSTFDELPHGMKVEDYTIEMMREVEKKYWRTLTFGEPAMYGADMAGSLFDNTTTAWNVAHLGDLLPRLAPKACKIPGVVSPYLYFGMWRATFAWHVEDADLYSINYIHFGAPKFWYAVPQEMSAKFERTMEGLFPTDRSNCPQFLRHKSFLASPRVLAGSGIVLNRVVQLPGEFILTYPKGYHSGFNLGFNCAESINFATEQWLPLGKVAKSCVCIGDSVNINVDAWLHHAALDEEEEDAKNPTSELAISRRKRSIPIESPEPIIEVPIEVVAEVEDVAPPAKKRRKSKVVNKLIQEEAIIEFIVAKASPKAKTVKLPKPIIQKPEKFVCALCPDMSKDGLVIIGEPDIVRGDLAAHRVCVLFTPATWIEIDPLDGKEIVRGFAGIEKARWKLKCHFCPEKHGTKVQCMKGKCPRAYHATCALQDDSGALVTFEQPQDESANVSPVEAEATKTVMLCKQHNPDHQRLEKERKEKELEDRVNAIPAGSRITIKTTGSSFDATFSAVLVEKSSISFTYDSGVPGEVKWKMIVFPDSPEVAEKKAIAAAKSKEQDVYVYDKPQQVKRRTSSIASPVVAISSLPHVAEIRSAAGPFSKAKGIPIRPSPVAPQRISQQVPQQSNRDLYQQSSQHMPPPHLQQSRAIYQAPASHGYSASQQHTSYSQSHLANLQHQEALQTHYATSHHQQQQPLLQRPQLQEQQQQQHIRSIPFTQSQPQAWPHTLPRQSFDYSRTMQHQSQRHSLDSPGPSSQIHYQSEQSQSRPLQPYQPQQQSQQSYGYPHISPYQHPHSTMNNSYSQSERDLPQSYDSNPIRRGLGQIPYPQQPTNYSRTSSQDYRSSGSM